jgi:hypothetical protein
MRYFLMTQLCTIVIAIVLCGGKKILVIDEGRLLSKLALWLTLLMAK